MLDLTHLFADADRCFSVIGGDVVNRNTSHLPWNYAASTVSELARPLSSSEVW